MQVSVISGVNVTVTSVESPLNITVATIPIYPGYDPAGLANIVDTEIAKNQVTGQFSISGAGTISIFVVNNTIVISGSH